MPIRECDNDVIKVAAILSSLPQCGKNYVVCLDDTNGTYNFYDMNKHDLYTLHHNI